MDLQETIDFTRITNALATLYPKLMNYAAIEAVNFFKERLTVGRDINNVPLKPRSKNVWVTRDRDKREGRAIGVDTTTMKRDIQKIYVTADTAIVGTTRISAPYAKAFNEGFKGVVTQNVKAHKRGRYKIGIVQKKELKKRSNISFGQVKTGEVEVKAFTRRVTRNQPARQIMGNSLFLDRRIQAMVTRKTIETITKASGK